MKIISCLLLAFVIVGCGKSSEPEKKVKIKRVSLSKQNEALSDYGLFMMVVNIPTSIYPQIVVVCKDTNLRNANTTNDDRAAALKVYKDGLRGVNYVIYDGGKRAKISLVNSLLDSAIKKVKSADPSSEKCPEVILGNKDYR